MGPVVVDVFLPCTKLRKIRAAQAAAKDMGTLQVPSVYSVDAEKGSRLELEAASEAHMLRLLQFIMTLLTKPGVQPFPVEDAAAWYYLDPKDKRRGPYSAAQLLKWHNKGFFGREFSCEHAGTRLWMPLWLVVGHYQASGTSAQDSGSTAAITAGQGSDVSDVLPELPVLDLDPWEDVDMEDVEELVQELRHQPEFVQALSSAAAMDTEALPDQDSEHVLLQLPDPMDVEFEQLLASTALQLATVPSASGRPGIDLRTALATLAPSAGLSPGQAVQWRLYLVLDTNVLLSRSALRVLEYIRARFGPKASGRNAGSTGGGAAGADGEVAGGGLSRRRSLEDAEEQVEDDPAVAEAQRQLLQVVAVVPWTVLLELDRLKSRGGGGGDDSAGAGGVAAQARAAIHALRAGLDAKDGFFRGETMAEYREASRQYGDAAGGIVSADDRILYCCLYFKDRLQAQQQQQQQQLGLEGGMDASMADVHGSGGAATVQQTRLVLLSNDTMMRNKADVNDMRSFSTSGMPISSSPHLLTSFLLQLLGLSRDQLRTLSGLSPSHEASGQHSNGHASFSFTSKAGQATGGGDGSSGGSGVGGVFGAGLSAAAGAGMAGSGGGGGGARDRMRTAAEEEEEAWGHAARAAAAAAAMAGFGGGGGGGLGGGGGGAASELARGLAAGGPSRYLGPQAGAGAWGAEHYAASSSAAFAAAAVAAGAGGYGGGGGGGDRAALGASGMMPGWGASGGGGGGAASKDSGAMPSWMSPAMGQGDNDDDSTYGYPSGGGRGRGTGAGGGRDAGGGGGGGGWGVMGRGGAHAPPPPPPPPPLQQHGHAQGAGGGQQQRWWHQPQHQQQLQQLHQQHAHSGAAAPDGSGAAASHSQPPPPPRGYGAGTQPLASVASAPGRPQTQGQQGLGQGLGQAHMLHSASSDDPGEALVHEVTAELDSLTAELGPLAERLLRQDFEELFESVVCRRLPWRGDDILAVLVKHWDSFARNVQTHRPTAKAQVEKLEKGVRQVINGHRRIGRQQAASLRAEFAEQLIEVRRAFGLKPPAAAAAVAAVGPTLQGSTHVALQAAGGGGGSGMGPGMGQLHGLGLQSLQGLSQAQLHALLQQQQQALGLPRVGLAGLEDGSRGMQHPQHGGGGGALPGVGALAGMAAGGASSQQQLWMEQLHKVQMEQLAARPGGSRVQQPDGVAGGVAARGGGMGGGGPAQGLAGAGAGMGMGMGGALEQQLAAMQRHAQQQQLLQQHHQQQQHQQALQQLQRMQLEQQGSAAGMGAAAGSRVKPMQQQQQQHDMGGSKDAAVAAMLWRQQQMGQGQQQQMQAAALQQQLQQQQQQQQQALLHALLQQQQQAASQADPQQQQVVQEALSQLLRQPSGGGASLVGGGATDITAAAAAAAAAVASAAHQQQQGATRVASHDLQLNLLSAANQGVNRSGSIPAAAVAAAAANALGRSSSTGSGGAEVAAALAGDGGLGGSGGSGGLNSYQLMMLMQAQQQQQQQQGSDAAAGGAGGGAQGQALAPAAAAAAAAAQLQAQVEARQRAMAGASSAAALAATFGAGGAAGAGVPGLMQGSSQHQDIQEWLSAEGLRQDMDLLL